MMDEEKLIEAVHGFPCLWKVSSRGYKDIRARENPRSKWHARSRAKSITVSSSFDELETIMFLVFDELETIMFLASWKPL